jgi:hypothetical protein
VRTNGIFLFNIWGDNYRGGLDTRLGPWPPRARRSGRSLSTLGSLTNPSKAIRAVLIFGRGLDQPEKGGQGGHAARLGP